MKHRKPSYRTPFHRKPRHWKPLHTVTLGALGLTVAAIAAPVVTRSQNAGPVNFVDSPNGNGTSRTLTTSRSFDTSSPFFQPLGTNGRTCATCHPVGQGMIITPDYAVQVFNATQGLDPLFAPVDGANRPDADMSTVQARQANCSMLLTKGLIRVGIPMLPNADFTVQAVDDPYGYSNPQDVSCFRRPLPATNLRFLSSVMWDGRELIGQKSVLDALAQQARDAVKGHMQAVVAPSASQVAQIVDFETHLYTSQIYDNDIGRINTQQIGAGPDVLTGLAFSPGINDAFGLVHNNGPFDQNVFTFYDDWLSNNQNGGSSPHSGPPPNNPPNNPPNDPPHNPPPPTPAQLSAARGERLFNTRQFTISGVAGLNDVTGRNAIKGTCSSCHSVPGVGSNALPLLLNTGIADGSLRTPDMPLYTLRNKKTGHTLQTTDPGAALTTGKWNDIGKFKVPSLRGLETQSPYMHNGFSGEILDILDFYDNRFSIGLSDQDKADIKAFLVTL